MQLPNSDQSAFWRHPLISCLSVSQQEWLASRIKQRTLPARSPIYETGEPAETLFFLLDGTLKLETASDQGEWLIKKIHAPGDFFGLQGLLGHPTRNEVARTLRNRVTLLVIQVQDVRRLLEVNLEFTEKLLEAVGKRLRFMENRTAILAEYSARERFARFVLEMNHKIGTYDGMEWFFNSQLTQAEIGNYIGTGRQTVTEILNEFKEQGVLRYTWGKFYISNIEALQ